MGGLWICASPIINHYCWLFYVIILIIHHSLIIIDPYKPRIFDDGGCLSLADSSNLHNSWDLPAILTAVVDFMASYAKLGACLIYML